MKRRLCLIEDLEGCEKLYKKLSCSNMYKNTIWFHSLLGAEKSCLKEDKVKKVHYKFEDGKEMVEEYNADTQVLLRRAWKIKGKLGGEGKWEVEIGDPIPDLTSNIDCGDITECKDQVIFEFEMTSYSTFNIDIRIYFYINDHFN